MKLVSLLLSFLLTFAAATAQTVVDVIVNSPDHAVLETAVIAAELADDLSGDGPFTVFAPTDAAFATLPAGVLDDLLADPTGALASVLLYHVAGDSVLSADLSDGQVLTTLNTRTVTVTIDANGVFINNAQVTVADIIADNGVVHVIDVVLIPPTTVFDVIAGSSDHDTLEVAIGAAGLAATLNGDGPFTVFAPTDDAFAALPAGVLDDLLADPTGALASILLYHTVSGSVESADLTDGQIITTLNTRTATITIDANGVFINNAQVTVADVLADNGVVHVINAVLLPPTTVYDVVAGSADHNTLQTAIELAELDDDLNGAGPFTVFAPTDAAFLALPAGVVDALLADPTGALADVLLYHVVGGLALSTDLSDGQVITTLNGARVTVTINANGVFINDAQVTVADIIADNGVVHVIDAVLLPPPPPTNTVVDVIVNSPDHTILETAVIAAELADDLSGDGPFTVFAPTDAAFLALPAGVVDALLADPTGALADVLLYHVAAGAVLSTSLADGQAITTLNGATVTVTINANGVFINDAQVTVADIIADNGVVHVIDAVLLPPPPPTNTVVDVIVNSPDHTILETAVIAAELADDLSGDGPFTVFAPTDAAFLALPAGVVDALLADPTGALADVLLYHVVSGNVLSTDLTDGQIVTTLNGATVTVTINANGVFINDAQVTVADIIADNGVVHVIDAVLLPPPPPTNTVVDVIVNSPDHTILETAVIAAELADDLSGDGPFTVFAPTDAAFLALPAGVVDALLADPTGALADVLLYHVVSGNVLSTDLTDGQIVTTLNGVMVTVTINANGVFINDAQVTVVDIIADNGVVHVIDAVLLPPPPPTNTVVDVIVNSPDHTILETAVIAAELADDLSGDGPFTVFAPTDAAFQALPPSVIAALLADPTGALADVLLYHVVSGNVLSMDLTDGQIVTTLNGTAVTVTINANGVFINDAQVTVADIIADNGVVHVIDAVLLPPPPPTNTVVDVIVNSPDHTILEAAVIAAGLADDLSGDGPFTVFAPTDAAFLALPAGVVDALLADPTGALADVLLYHVVGGLALSTNLSDGQVITTLNGATVTVTINANGVFINDAQVTVADIIADNGVVHVIDAVLLPPPPPTNTVVDVIVNSPDHTILETAVIAAELADDLSGDGPFTVFAPTDAAFQALPPSVIAALLADPTGALADVLLYHVVSGNVLSTDLTDGQIVTTLNGATVTVTINANGVFINDAQVTVADIIADNGVVHVIDAVLLPPPPPTNTVVDVIVNSPDHTILEAAVIAAGLADDLSGDGPFTVFAPTDAAFLALPAGVVDALLADPTGALADVLLYHVAAGAVLSTSLADGQAITTLNGSDVTVTINANGVFINNAQVTVADIIADNGVVHVIDAVLLPPSAVESLDNSPVDVQVFPNPATDIFRVKMNGQSGQLNNIRLIDLNGRILRTWNFGNNFTDLEVSTFQSGSYILLFDMEGKHYYKQVVIQR